MLTASLSIGLSGAAALAPIGFAKYLGKKYEQELQQVPAAVQRTYEIEKQFPVELRESSGLEAIAALYTPEIRKKYGELAQEYSNLLEQKSVKSARAQISASTRLDTLYVLISTMAAAMFVGGILAYVGKISDYLCSYKK